MCSPPDRVGDTLIGGPGQPPSAVCEAPLPYRREGWLRATMGPVTAGGVPVGRSGRGVRWLLAALAVTALAGYGSRPAGASPNPPDQGALTAQALEAGADHACIVTGSPQPDVDWSELHNPILSEPAGGVKDQAIIWAGGRWHMLFSYVVDDPSFPGGVRWNIATATSQDLVHWTHPAAWPLQRGVLGVASPDIVRSPSGAYLVTYQSDPGAASPSDDQARLFYRTSTDLRTWSAPRPLAQSLAPSPGDRMIDGAFVFTGHQLLVGFKYSSPTQPDVFEIARSTTGTPAGPWRLVGRPDIEVRGDTIENYEFVAAAGRWRLVATSNTLDEPWIFTLAGDPGRAGGWLRWDHGYELQVPSEAFDTGPGVSSIDYEHANSAFLCDARVGSGGYYYLLYAGSDELTQFDGWGHAEVGVARSTDLIHWQVPPERSPPR